MSVKVELVCNAKAALGEGPMWDHRKRVLFWVDIHAGRVHIFDPSTKTDRTIEVGQEVGCAVPRQAGGLIVGLSQGIGFLDIESETVRVVVDPEKHIPENRFNDGKCDPAGRFWTGTLAPRIEGKRKEGTASLYCLSPDMTIRTMVRGVTVSNGLAWSSDEKTMYYNDTATLKVSAFDYEKETGEISGRRTVVEIDPTTGKPDGMTIDEEDMLWVAHYGGGRITRWDPRSGEQMETIEVPAPNTTSCAFGGPRLDELFITTGRAGLDADALKAYPKSGGLFRVKPGVKGRPEPAFAG